MKQELIERFELEHPNEPAYLPIVGGKEHLGIETSRIYSDAFHNWLRDTVIAELQSENEGQASVVERLDKMNDKLAERNGVLILENMGLKAQAKNFKIDRKSLQEKYDKLKERVEGAQVKTFFKSPETGNLLFAHYIGEYPYPLKYVALVELTPREVEMNDENLYKGVLS